MLSRLNRAMPTNAGAAVVARPRAGGVTPFVLAGIGSTYGVDVSVNSLRPKDSAGETTG